jgi:glycosyltransferase involved in cell wall biosynthesis
MNQYRVSLVKAVANANALNAALAFSEQDLLEEIVTTLAFNPKSNLAQILDVLPDKIGNSVRDELSRRTWLVSSSGCIRQHSTKEIIRVLASRYLKPLLSSSVKESLIGWVYTSLDNHAAQAHLNNIDAVYGYEDEAQDIFLTAKQKGMLCLYDLPIPFHKMSRDIQAEEAERFPELSGSMQAVKEPAWKVERKEQEVQLADHFFVASSMTQRSLLEIGIPTKKISVIPYGAPIDYFQPQLKMDHTFRVMFAGRSSPRKGVHYLLQAWKELNLPDAELMLVGNNLMPSEWFSQYEDSCRHVPSVPHFKLNSYYSSASVLVFPSLVEGFGLVLTEAMACGIPIITTPNTAGPDLITDGIEGFIIPIRDVEALKEKLEWCYRHPQELSEMGHAARKKAEGLTWNKYQTELGNKVKEILED